ncbi:MAG: hypothetical protein AAF215_28465 [Cyanobacteria bacterium P01_A01_bin.123]
MARLLTRWTVADYHHMIASGLLAGRQVELVDFGCDHTATGAKG